MDNENDIKIALLNLFNTHFSEDANNIEPITNSASNRLYFKITSKNHIAVGTYSANKEETSSFEYLTGIFKKFNLPVPEIYAFNHTKTIYLQEYLADQNLLQLINKIKQTPNSENNLLNWYKKTIDWLLCFQILPSTTIDYSKCFPINKFNNTSIAWDLNYFKYFFILPQFTQLNELKLETDFQKIIEYVVNIDSYFFMYRDFQARNILVKNDNLYFIDYQGGRQGPLHYDLASLLMQAQINLSWEQRFILIKYYNQQLTNYKIYIPLATFENDFLIFALLRTFQVLGAYGYRGLIEKKEYFIKSIPFALDNLMQLITLLSQRKIINLPYISEITNIINK